MAAVTPDTGAGASITFSSGFFATLLGLEWSGISREVVETTTLGVTSGGRTYLPAKRYDPGSIVARMQFDSDLSPPISAVAETVTVTFDDAETWAASGMLVDFAFTVEGDELMEATATVKLTGDITF